MQKFLRCFLCVWIAAACDAKDTGYKNYTASLSEIIDASGFRSESISLLIDKSEYKLTVLLDTVIVKEYPVVFGKNPRDDKLRQGDRCTPEGTFHMITKYPHEKWSKFIWLDYPNEGSWQKHAAAKREGIIPENSTIGGEIGIHGVPESMDMLIDIRYNWTLGCVAMKNKDIEELYPYISESIRIEISK